MFFLASGIISGYSQERWYYSGPENWRNYNRPDYSGRYQYRNNYDDRYRYYREDFYRSNNRCGTPDYSNTDRSRYRVAPMSDENFRTVMNYISGLSFDSEKLTQAKQIIRNNTMTSAQVKQLVAELTFDSNRLELAKSAFPNVSDKGMYFLVGEEFTFSSSRDHLNEYLLSMGY